MSNGEELGDPNCEWQEGQEPKRSHNITHPGICEPVDDPKCSQNDPNLCKYQDLECSPLANETGNKTGNMVQFIVF